MAGTARKVGQSGLRGSVERTLIEEYNKVQTDLEAIKTAAATSLAAIAAVTITSAKIQNNQGTEYTATAG